MPLVAKETKLNQGNFTSFPLTQEESKEALVTLKPLAPVGTFGWYGLSPYLL